MATQSNAAGPVLKTGKPSAAEKGDATTRAAREIIERERAARDANTARLRALRLAKEQEAVADDVPAAPIKAPKSPSRTRKKT